MRTWTPALCSLGLEPRLCRTESGPGLTTDLTTSLMWKERGAFPTVTLETVSCSWLLLQSSRSSRACLPGLWPPLAMRPSPASPGPRLTAPDIAHCSLPPFFFSFFPPSFRLFPGLLLGGARGRANDMCPVPEQDHVHRPCRRPPPPPGSSSSSSHAAHPRLQTPPALTPLTGPVRAEL